MTLLLMLTFYPHENRNFSFLHLSQFSSNSHHIGTPTKFCVCYTVISRRIGTRTPKHVVFRRMGPNLKQVYYTCTSSQNPGGLFSTWFPEVMLSHKNPKTCGFQANGSPAQISLLHPHVAPKPRRSSVLLVYIHAVARITDTTFVETRRLELANSSQILWPYLDSC